MSKEYKSQAFFSNEWERAIVDNAIREANETTKSDTILKGNKMSQNRTEKQKVAIIEALEKSLGIVTDACNEVDIARSTFYKWYKEDEDFKAKVDSVEDMALDFAESQLHKQIQEGIPTSTIFYLKTKGRKRGYVEQQIIDMNLNKLTVKFEDED